MSHDAVEQPKSGIPTCANCRHWAYEGQCRRNPPVAAGTSERAYTYWPETTADDWCGEWAPKRRVTGGER